VWVQDCDILDFEWCAEWEKRGKEERERSTKREENKGLFNEL